MSVLARRRGILSTEKGFWNPARLGIDLLLWYDAADSNTFVFGSGSNLQNWLDKSSYQQHAIQPNADRQPALIGNGIEFDGVDDYMQTVSPFSELSGDPEFATYLVYRKTNAEHGPAFGTGRINFGRESFGLFDDNLLTAYSYAGNNNYFVQPIATNVKLIHEYIKTPGPIISTSQALINGNPVGTGGHSVNTPNIYPNAPLRIGRFANFLGLFLQGTIYEFVILKTTEEQFRMEGYLAHKWNLDSELPLAHPYKFDPP